MSMNPIERTLVDSFGAGAGSVFTYLSVAKFGVASEPSMAAGILTAMFATNAIIHARKLSCLVNNNGLAP